MYTLCLAALIRYKALLGTALLAACVKSCSGEAQGALCDCIQNCQQQYGAYAATANLPSCKIASCQLLVCVLCVTKQMLTVLSVVPMQVVMQLLTTPWTNLHRATQAQLADP